MFIILTTVISSRKNQWYIVLQLLLEQNIWQAWSLVFLHTKLLVCLKIIFFISLKTTKITSKIQISEVCDIQFHKYNVCCSYQRRILMIRSTHKFPFNCKLYYLLKILFFNTCIISKENILNIVLLNLLKLKFIYRLDVINWLIDWLIDWCLMPTLVIFQQYHAT